MKARERYPYRVIAFGDVDQWEEMCDEIDRLNEVIRTYDDTLNRFRVDL